MGGGGRVLTQLEQNAKFLENYVEFTKLFKYLDLEKGEIEINFDSAFFNPRLPKSRLLRYIIRNFEFLTNNKLIFLKIEKMLFETKDLEEIIDYFKGNRYRFRFLRKEDSEGFLGKDFWNEFEILVSKSTEFSFRYAELINDKFELGECSISKSSEYSLEYARIIKGRFELGEKAISEKNKDLYEYAKIIGPLPKKLYNAMVANCIASS